MATQRPHYVEEYQTFVTSLFEEHSPEEAASLAVGGAYDVMGDRTIALLRYLGIDMASDIIDVGCGSERLATKLIPNGFTGNYLGTDVVPQLLDLRGRGAPTEFRFELVEDLIIPADDCSADTVTVFSVFTHLRHDESYLYLREIHRVLRPEGRAIISFLEFAEPNHWDAFTDAAQRTEAKYSGALSQFVELNAIQLWAEKLGFAPERFIGGYEPSYPTVGQSVAILRKLPSNSTPRGCIDRCDTSMIAGWFDTGGQLPSLDIHVNGRWVCTLCPDAYREDLDRAGLGDGRRGFGFSLDGRLGDGENIITVLYSGTPLFQPAIRQIGLEEPNAAHLSDERWRGDEPPEGLTWGRIMSGDTLWDIYLEAHEFLGSDRIVEFGPGYGRLLKTALARNIPFRSFIGIDLSQARASRLAGEFRSDARIQFFQGKVNVCNLNQEIDIIYAHQPLNTFIQIVGRP
jgi:SAM-dependent methyltransferase